jgi:hypothetical protein
VTQDREGFRGEAHAVGSAPQMLLDRIQHERLEAETPAVSDLRRL